MPDSVPKTPQPLRMLFVHDHLGSGGGVTHGGTKYLLETLPGLKARGWDVHLLLLRPYHRAAEMFEGTGIPLYFCSRSRWDPRGFFDVIRYARAHDIALVQTNGQKANILGRAAAVLMGLPFTMQMDFEYTPTPAVVHRWFGPRTAGVICASTRLQHHANAAFHVPIERCHIVHTGMDVESFVRLPPEARCRVRKELHLRDDQVAIGLVGRVPVHPDKGQRIAIQAMPELLSKHPEAVLCIVGDGVDLDGCRTLAEELRVTDAVRFTGHRDDIPEVTAALDIATAPGTFPDAWPFTLTEAMCAGKPVVAARVGGIIEQLGEGARGLLVEPGDPRALARAFADVIEHPDAARQRVANGREFAKTLTVDHHVEQLDAIYREILQSAARN